MKAHQAYYEAEEKIPKRKKYAAHESLMRGDIVKNDEKLNCL